MCGSPGPPGRAGLHTGFFREGGGNFFFIAGETMWLIDHSEGEGVGGGCAPSHAAYSAETYSF